MPASIISPNIIHAWLPSGFVLLRNSEDDYVSFTAAATCFSNTENTVWIATSQTDILRRVSCNIISPHNSHVTTHVVTTQLEHPSQLIQLDVGTIQAISVVPPSQATNHDTCTCQLYICGESGYAIISTHDNKVLNQKQWDTLSDSILFANYILTGRLRDAIVLKGFISHSVIMIASTGQVFATTARNLYTTSKLTSHPTTRKLVHLYQRPIWVKTDTANNFMLILGCLRAGVVLYVDENNSIVVDRFVLPGRTSKLSAETILLHETGYGKLVFEESVTGQRVNITYNKETSSVEVDIDYDRISDVGNPSKINEPEVIIRDLLRGVADLGNYHEIVRSSTEKVNRLIASYNQAALYAKSWNTAVSNDTGKDLQRSCTISVSSLPVMESPRYHIPEGITGKEKYITVSFTNTTEISLADGWFIKLTVYKQDKDICEENHTRTGQLKSSSALHNGIETSFCRECTGNINVVPSGASKSISFPILIDSHAPMYANVALCFSDPSASLLRNTEVDIEISLVKDFCLDIIQCSESVNDNEASERSDHMFILTQLNEILSISESERKASHPLIMRYQVPLSVRKIYNKLNMKKHIQTYMSALGSTYSIGIAEPPHGPHHGENDEVSISTITLRAEKHVLPFVKAAITKRLLLDIPNDKDILGPYGRNGKKEIELWTKQISNARLNNVDKYREAESKLVECVNFFEDIDQNNSLVNCVHGRERELLSSSHETAKDLYMNWRRDVENILTMFSST